MLFRMGKKVLSRMPLLPGLNDAPAGLEAAFAMLREEAAQGADIAARNCCPNRYGEGQVPPARTGVHLRKTLSGGASGGTQGPFSRPGARRD